MSTTRTRSWKDVLAEAVTSSLRPMRTRSGDVVCIAVCGPLTFAWAEGVKRVA